MSRRALFVLVALVTACGGKGAPAPRVSSGGPAPAVTEDPLITVAPCEGSAPPGPAIAAGDAPRQMLQAGDSVGIERILPSRDGKRVATLGRDGVMRVWDVPTRTLLRVRATKASESAMFAGMKMFAGAWDLRAEKLALPGNDFVPMLDIASGESTLVKSLKQHGGWGFGVVGLLNQATGGPNYVPPPPPPEDPRMFEGLFGIHLIDGKPGWIATSTGRLRLFDEKFAVIGERPFDCADIANSPGSFFACVKGGRLTIGLKDSAERKLEKMVELGGVLTSPTYAKEGEGSALYLDRAVTADASSRHELIRIGVMGLGAATVMMESEGAMRISGDATKLLETVGRKSTLRDLTTGALIESLPPLSQPMFVGDVLVGATDDGLWAFNPRTGRPMGRFGAALGETMAQTETYGPHGEKRIDRADAMLVFGKDTLAVLQGDSRLVRWSLATGTPRVTLLPPIELPRGMQKGVPQTSFDEELAPTRWFTATKGTRCAAQELFIADPRVATAKRLCLEEGDFVEAVAPRGAHIVVHRKVDGRTHRLLVPTAGGVDRDLGTCSRSTSDAFFSRDSMYVAACGQVHATTTGAISQTANRFEMNDDGDFVPTGDKSEGTYDVRVIQKDHVEALPPPEGAPRVTAHSKKLGVSASVDEDGVVRIRDLDEKRLRVGLAEWADGEYIAFTPNGAYSGTAEAGDRIAWIYGSPFEALRFEQFAAHYNKPDVVRVRLAGQNTDVEATSARPPRITEAIEVKESTTNARATMRVSVESGARVDKVVAFVDGRPAGAARVCKEKGTVDVSVPVATGTNHVSLVAFDAHGASSRTSDIDVRIAGNSQKAPAIWGLTVGITSYPHLFDKVKGSADARESASRKASLPAARHDATAVGEMLQKLVARGSYSQANVTTLTDDKGPVSAADIRKALDSFSKMGPDDIGVVLFAGHGFKQDAAADMVFATSGSQLREDQRGLSEASLKTDAVGWSDIEASIGRARGRVVVLVDACHSGHIQQELMVPNEQLASGLIHARRAGAIVFAASKGREVSYEPDTARGLVLDTSAPVGVGVGGGQHGFFTGAWLESAADPGTDANGDGFIQISEMINAVTMRVQAASDGKQNPWVARREIFGDFAIARSTAPSRAPIKLKERRVDAKWIKLNEKP